MRNGKADGFGRMIFGYYLHTYVGNFDMGKTKGKGIKYKEDGMR